MSMEELTKSLKEMQLISEYLIQFDADIVMEAQSVQEDEDQHIQLKQTPEMEYLRNLYDSEIYPGTTILWKAMQVANFTVGSILLDNGLASVNY